MRLEKPGVRGRIAILNIKLLLTSNIGLAKIKIQINKS
jgi:hypothetical protein